MNPSLIDLFDLPDSVFRALHAAGLRTVADVQAMSERDRQSGKWRTPPPPMTPSYLAAWLFDRSFFSLDWDDCKAGAESLFAAFATDAPRAVA